MMLSNFLRQMFDTGQVVVSMPQSDADIDEAQAVAVLVEAELTWRQQLPSCLPVFDTNLALWSASTVYRAAQLLVYRELPEDAVRSWISPRTMRPSTSSEHYSVDLCFRFMKDILRLGKALSEDDPLNVQIQLLMKDWPLSSVGLPMGERSSKAPALPEQPSIGPIEPVTVQSAVWTDSALRLMYLDRIQRLGDTTAMQSDHVAAELKLWDQPVGLF